jgi:transposase
MAQDQGGALRRGAWICFLDESGCSLRPPVRRTWAPRGQTPILRHRGHWKRASMAGICCYRPDGSRARLCFHTQPDSYNDHTLIGVLKQLRRFLRGAPATLVWDNLPSHHSRVMGGWLDTQRHWLQVEYLPGYAHDLDPVEGLWANLKGCELANRCCADRRELIATAQVGSIRVRRDPDLLRSFLAGTPLTLRITNYREAL